MDNEKGPYQSAIDRFSALLKELEQAAEHAIVEWSERDAIEAQRRIDRISARIRDIVHRLSERR
jgi:hypothetical protein